MNELTLREKFRKFKRAASLLRDAWQNLPEDKPRFSISSEEDKPVTSSLNETPRDILLAALLRPFMSSDSPIELGSLWTELCQEPDLVAQETIAKFNRGFKDVEKLGMALTYNGRELTGRDMYFAYAEGEFFDEKPKAKALLERFNAFGPMGENFMKFMFHSVCSNYAHLVLAFVDVVLEAERRRPELKPPPPESVLCIYCGCTDPSKFTKEEHVFPETLGIDEMRLYDAVCDDCNNKLSTLDQALIEEFDPIAVLRIQYVPLTKKGKFPHAKFRDFDLLRVAPRVVRIVNKTKKDVLETTPLPDGQVKMTLRSVGRKPVNILKLARAVFKIGLGMAAFDEGAESAANERYNAAREFIHGRGTVPNHLIILSVIEPSPSVAGRWGHFENATCVELSIYGVHFIFNLEATPFGVLPGAPEGVFQQFWLGEETPKGIVDPCKPDCGHPIQPGPAE